ncbi:response regulator transcription factor [Psychrobium sp. 1_MG-2023]|uniref:response regulator transcription factor n=1 Tax=Psychrobium sp. 1_MG-2023 TaxID=3062624 RepID=UPI000C3437F8|nr:response regulator transcription factor [Psychrobium sp. 1_MG-2023]MDP2560273.1 response regulator transcription factor [Psychrobium sp. 1_MG-2023]PKF55390.1 DNA-binding response regulator [Alteromonadales bacterium alter-6D02]
MSDNYKILIADDHPLFRNALRQALESAYPDTQWLEAESADSLQAVLEDDNQLDLVILDLQMPGSHGYSTLIHLRSHFPTIPVVVISAHEDNNTIAKSMHYGSCGFIPKSTSMEKLADALDQILQGETWIPEGIDLSEKNVSSEGDFANRLSELTPQQYKVLQMFGEGLLNKQIAYDLDVSEATIKAHATAIFRKLNVRNRTQAVIALSQLEVTHQPPE